MNTATTHDALAHARSQAGARNPYQPTVPASDATDLPDGVDPALVIWEETIGPGGYSARQLPRGAIVRLTDVDGDACANVLVYNALRPVERLNVADTVKVQWQAYLGAGALLLSDMGRALMSVAADTSAHHDALCGGSNERRNVTKYGSGAVHGRCPNSRDRFAVAVAKFGLGRREIPPCVNFFKGVHVEPSGALEFTGSAGSGTYVELRAELPVLFAVANTPHVLDPRTDYTATALRVTAWRSGPTTRTDELWSSTPEVERAFLNSEAFLQEWAATGEAAAP